MAASGPLAATARSRSRNSSPVATGKKASELATMSISDPSGRWKRTAMPCGLALASPSGIVGTPVASEKRTVTGTGSPANRAALLSVAPAALGWKLPSATMPLAWLARWPGCLPNSWFITSTICVGTSASSAWPGKGRAQARAAASAAVRRSLIERMVTSRLGWWR